jgi:transketolase
MNAPNLPWKAGTPTALKVYGQTLIEVARERPDIVCLGADLSGPTETDLFHEAIPDRFFNIGMAEANLIGIAAGMALSGDTPFVNTFGVFATRRPFDQIAMQVDYPRANVKIVGHMPGLTSPGGVTHQATEDVALMRTLPNMVVVEAADASELRLAVRAVAEHDGPVYLRVKRGESPVLFGEDHTFRLGQAQLVRDGGDGVIFASGLMVSLALEAADVLLERGRSVSVANVHTLKPLDTAFVVEHARRTGVVVTAENHSIIGGLGSAVAETLVEAGVSVAFRRVGVRDVWAEGASARFLFKKYRLSADAIVEEFEQAHAAARS